MIRKRNLSWVKANLCQMKVNLRILFFLALGNAGVMVGMVDRQNFPNYHLKCTGITSYFLGGVDPPHIEVPHNFSGHPPDISCDFLGIIWIVKNTFLKLILKDDTCFKVPIGY